MANLGRYPYKSAQGFRKSMKGVLNTTVKNVSMFNSFWYGNDGIFVKWVVDVWDGVKWVRKNISIKSF